MDMLSRLAKVIGLALVFVGVLLVVAGGSVPGSCFTTGTNCSASGTNFPSQLANVLLVGKLLFVIGLAAFMTGAFVKMRGLQNPPSGKREDLDYVIADRRFNGLLIIVCLLLMAFTLFTVNMAPIVGPGIP
jgi:hypothetical protein